jgi:hypothetical protein
MGRNLAVPDANAIQSAKCPGDDTPFDYGELSSPVAKFLRGQADRIRQTVRASIIHLGKDLIAAKRYLSHGAFLHWVESEVGIPARTAQAYMQAAQWSNGKGASVRHLPPSLLYVLSAPSTPKEFALDILRKIEGGEHVTLTGIRAELKTLRLTKHKERPEGTPARPQSRHDDRSAQQPSAEAERAAALLQVATIVARGLARSDLAQVCKIMTSKLVLDDPALQQSMAVAFMTAERLSDEWVSSGSAQEHIARGDPSPHDEPQRPRTIAAEGYRV